MPKNNPKLPPIPADAGDASRQSKTDRRAAAQQLMRDQQRKAKRRTAYLQLGIGAVVIALVVGITLVVLSRRDSSTPSSSATPPGLTSDGGILFGSTSAAAKVSAIEDFQCPICQQFESQSGDLLKSYREGSDVSVEYRPIAFLDRSSSTEYSSRALNASMCVLAAKGKDAWMTMHGLLYANQPAEGGAGLPDSDLVDMANQAGATGDDVQACIDDRRYGDWVEKQTDSIMGVDGVNGTPTVSVNGQVVSSPTSAAIQAAVTAASGS